ncbi:MAG: hypothetical protein HXX14_04065 [Bacteroidetes bacterium]|nr:hypothetical protein [Bacteroidota bacterium]
MEELWTKYGDIMDKPICIGKILKRFIICVWGDSNEDRNKFSDTLINDQNWIKVLSKKQKTMKMVF